MNVIIAADIFGITDTLLNLQKQLSKHVEVAVFDPYHGEVQSFSDEEQAYQAFVESGGVDAYFEQLNVIMMFIEQPVVLIGFSAGAAALWRLTDDKLRYQASHFIGFYPGQIRHYLDITPGVDSTLIFPQHEPHFDVSDVMTQLNHPSIQNRQLRVSHGFMNKLSPGFDANAAIVLTKLLTDKQLISSQDKFVAALETKKPSLLVK